VARHIAWLMTSTGCRTGARWSNACTNEWEDCLRCVDGPSPVETVMVMVRDRGPRSPRGAPSPMP